MLKSFNSDRVRFRESFPEVFKSGEDNLIALGASPEEAVDATYEALQEYFDLLSKMIYMLGYELASEMKAPFPEDEDLTQHRTVTDLDKEEVMNELNRIMNISN